MAKVVEIPGVGNVEFPDSMGDAEISKHAQRLYGAAEFDKTKSRLESQPPMTTMDKVKAIGGMIASPITGIPGAVGELKDWVASGFTPPVQKPDGRLGAPDYMTENPVSDIMGGTVAAVLAARPGTPKAAGAQEATAGSSPGLFSTMRTLYNAYKTIKKATPTAIAEKGFETFLDHLEGKTPEPPKPSAPSAPIPINEAPKPRTAYARNAPIRPPLVDPNPPIPEQPAPQPRTGPIRPPLVGDIPPPTQVEAEIQSATPSPKVEPITKANIRPKVQSIAEQLRDAMNESGSAPTEAPEGIPGKVYEADARGTKAEVVAKALKDNGISYQDARGLMEVADWKKLYSDLGLREPGASSGDPSATINQTLVKLKKLYDAEKPAEAPRQRIRRTKKP